MKSPVLNLLRNTAEIFFLEDRGLGLVILTLLCYHPGGAVLGSIAVAAACAFAHLSGLKNSRLQESGFYTYNPLLVGLALGYRFGFNPSTVALAVAAGVATLVITALLAQVLYTY